MKAQVTRRLVVLLAVAAAVVVVLFAFSTPAFAQDPQQEETPEPVNVAGEWVMTMDVMEATLTLTQEGAQYHIDAITALTARNGEAARQAIERDILDAYERLSAVLKSRVAARPPSG